VDPAELFKSAKVWKRMVGVDQKVLSVIFEKEDPEKINASGKGDMSNAGAGGDEGEGGGSGSGSGEGEGTGGSGGSGEGGSGGSGGGGSTDMNENGREATFVDVSTLELVSIATFATIKNSTY
jgi:hypothetical protein